MRHLQKFETYGFEEELGMEVQKPTCDSCGCEDCECDPTEKHEGDVCPSCGCEDCECVETKSYESRHLFNFQLFLEQKTKDGKFDPEMTKRISAMSKKTSQVDQRALGVGYDSKDPNNPNLDYGALPEFTEDTEAKHDINQWVAIISSFLGPYGLTFSTLVSLYDAHLYFKENNKKMGILMLIFTCLPMLKYTKLLMVGKSTLGIKGIMGLLEKFSFKGGKFILNKGVKLTLDEKRYLIAIVKNSNVIVDKCKDKIKKIFLEVNYGWGNTLNKLIEQTMAIFCGVIVYEFGYDVLVDTSMDKSEQEEIKNILEKATEDLKIDKKNQGVGSQTKWEDYK